MPMSVSYHRRTVMGELEWGETLEEFYKLHNLDENRKSPGYKVRTKWIRPRISKYIREDEDEDSW
jgi:hypothetical protein